MKVASIIQGINKIYSNFDLSYPFYYCHKKLHLGSELEQLKNKINLIFF
jgi:hypothetical protein